MKPKLTKNVFLHNFEEIMNFNMIRKRKDITNQQPKYVDPSMPNIKKIENIVHYFHKQCVLCIPF